MTVLIRYQANGDILLRAPYNPDFLHDLKQLIPARHREWLPDDRLWHISARFAPDATVLARSWFDAVEIIPHRRAQDPGHPPSPKTIDSLARLHLRETAPWPVVEAAYKALARLHHPDKGGDQTTMKHINAAYTNLKENKPQ